MKVFTRFETVTRSILIDNKGNVREITVKSERRVGKYGSKRVISFRFTVLSGGKVSETSSTKSNEF